MFKQTYKNILNQLPAGVILLDGKFRVRFTNAAFRQHFPESRGTGDLCDVLSCAQQRNSCGHCPLRSAFEAAADGGDELEKVVPSVRGEDGEKKVALRVKVKPVGKYYLGIIDDCYEMEIAKELQVAQSIQRRLLPAAKEAGGISFAYLYLPCREIGGDLPDVYEIGRNTVGVIADVSGKGISAGMLSAFVKAGWNKGEPSPARAIAGLNEKFRELNMDERSYITAEAVNIDSDRKTITYSTAGHIVPILHKSGFKINEITYKSPPISNWLDDFTYLDHTMTYESGDILVLMTDGIVESKNNRGEQFGIERVEGILMRSGNAQRFIERLKAELYDFCDVFNDDLTAIAFDLA